MVKQAIRQWRPINLWDINEITDSTLFILSSINGAPTVAMEKIISPSQVRRAFEMMEKTLTRSASGTSPIEVGGINSLIPFILAAKKQIRVVDCDSMGRAFPEVKMITFYLDEVPSGPNTFADEKGNTLVLYPIDGMNPNASLA
ncbi:MAG: S-methyl thiohydantoin desulfurase domain-containing protein [Candidatus Malihini olakiniferum]